MLGIQKIDHLARHLETTSEHLLYVSESADSYFEHLELFDPAKPEKRAREVVNVKGRLRILQRRLLQNLIRPKHQPSQYSHGGVRGRHIKSNVANHIESFFAFTTDIANFYPSISHKRVYNLFVNDFKCSPDVARICTKLCTHRHHLALGLITSPILADRLMLHVDYRIGKLCENHDIIYTRFVDDITLSSYYPIKKGSFSTILVDILGSCGFKVNAKKHLEGLEGLGRLADGKCITKLEIKRGKICVRSEFFEEITNQLLRAHDLACCGKGGDHYYTPGQIYGRIQFVEWINAGQAVILKRLYRSIDWQKVESKARSIGLVATRKQLTRILSKTD